MKRLIYILAGVLLAVSCSHTAEQTIGSSDTLRPYATDELLVKFSPRVAAMVEQLGVDGARVTRCGDVSIDEVLSVIGTCSVERVFPIDERAEERTIESGLHLWYVVRFDASQMPVEEVARRFARLGEVQKVDVNRTIKRAYTGRAVPLSEERLSAALRSTTRSTMSDPLLAAQWNLVNNGEGFCKDGVVKSVKDADVQVERAWERSTGDNSVIVAVLDEGVFYEHPDLLPNMWVNEGETIRSDEDADGNGYAGDKYGYNFVHDSGVIVSNDAYDSGHGTHVAGVIAAVNNNGIGISSIAGGDGSQSSGVRIMGCQIFSGNVATSILSTVRAIKYAADNGAVVLQCSWGYVSPCANVYDWGAVGFGSLEEWIAGSPLEREALEYFTHKAGSPNGAIEGGIAVFAGGNESAAAAGYPGAADDYISVAATAADFTPAVYTNYGMGTTVSAPGGDQDYYYDYVTAEHNYGEVGCILSTLPMGKSTTGYGYMEGTSMACPHVSGVLALGISYAADQRRHFKATELQQLLLDTTMPIDDYQTGTKLYMRYAADLGPIRPMQMTLSNYRGGMGTGQVDAAAFLGAIDGAGVELKFPNIYLATGGVTAIAPARYFEQGQTLTYEVSIADSSIASMRTHLQTLYFQGLKEGTTQATITASNGVKQEFVITVRRGAGNGWL